MNHCLTCITLGLSFWLAGAAAVLAEPAPLQVSSDFPGGSGEVIRLDQDERLLVIRPTPYEDRGWQCWWHVKIEGAEPGSRWTVEVGDAPWATPQRAAIRFGQGPWGQTEAGERDGRTIRYSIGVEEPVFELAWGPPFTLDDARQLVQQVAEQCEEAETFILSRSREGRDVPALRFRPRDAEPQLGIWINARQHAWESGSSWVCYGVVQWLASDDPRARSLRQKACITVIPVMDVDNVQRGAGGKNQEPHDHNRDWGDNPHFPEVAAAIERIQQLDAEQRLDMFLDLHNPGAASRNPFYFIAPRSLLSERGERNLDHFLAASRMEIDGPLAFLGETYESGSNYDAQWQAISKNWVTMNARDHVVAITLETPWNTPHSTIDGYRRVGRQLAMAVERYFRVDPHREMQGTRSFAE